jgi:hypothetical protein
MRQCVGCGTALAPERRSPHCERCRVDYQRQRNRGKVSAYRNRLREALASQANATESRAPNEEEFAWLGAINLGLEEPIRRVHELLKAGKGVSDPEVVQLARGALQQYDSLRNEFDTEVTAESEAIAASWRGYFESIRKVLG